MSTEQGASASDLVAAKSFDAVARMPGMAGSAADCVSAYTQVKLEEMYRLLKLPKNKCPVIWIKIPRDRWPKWWYNKGFKDPVVPLLVNLYGHPLAGLLWEKHLEEKLFRLVGRSSSLGNAPTTIKKQDFS